MENAVRFEKVRPCKRVSSMLNVDFRRMFKSGFMYILIGAAFVMPLLMTVMMTMMDGTVSVNPQTGVETIVQGPENTWQNIGTLPGGEMMGGMEVFMMCNINMMFMAVAVFVCLFISSDFKSGFAKNLFTVRTKRGDYVISKMLSGFVCGVFMLLAYFLGTVLGGAISGLSFDLCGLSGANLMLCMLAKMILMMVFVSIFTLISIAAKEKTWLALCGSLGCGMLLFMMVSMITPLNATLIHVILCLAGSVLFFAGLGIASKKILRKARLV